MKKLALTYDDGPNTKNTRMLLDVLGRHKVPATFFVLGSFITRYPAIVWDVVAAGHVLGNHTYDHPDLHNLTSVAAQAQIDACEKSFSEIGLRSSFYPPPVWSPYVEGYYTASRDVGCGQLRLGTDIPL